MFRFQPFSSKFEMQERKMLQEKKEEKIENIIRRKQNEKIHAGEIDKENSKCIVT